MKEQIEKVYQELKVLLPSLEQIRILLWKQDYYRANQKMTEGLTLIEDVLVTILGEQTYFADAACDTSRESVMSLLNSLLTALDAKEYVLLADILGQSVLPFFYALQELITGTELVQPIAVKSGEVAFQVEYTSCGLPTVRASKEGKEFYMHSNLNARQEACQLAESWKEAEKKNYIIYGCGLGYPVTALIEGNEYLSVQVFECNDLLLQLAQQYGDYNSLIASGQVSIQPDPDAMAFTAAVRKNPQAVVCFFAPSLRLISNRKAAERMEDVFISYSSQKNQYSAMLGNFEKNIRHYDALADVLKPQFSGKRVYLVAAGPSLDTNYLRLRQVEGEDIVIAAGTVLKKLLKHGIVPDYVMVSDAKAPTFLQMKGAEDAGIPLLGLSTAYFRFFTEYHAVHYLVCQQDFAPAEQFAAEHGCMLIQTGGSVITAALDTALQLGAAEIVFAGLDLALTGGRDHAAETDFAANQIHGEQRMVEDINGNQVQTARNLDMYRRFIERRIAEFPKVRFIDATEGGARIQGAELMTLREAVNSTRKKE